jgi:hypothetical protein
LNLEALVQFGMVVLVVVNNQAVFLGLEQGCELVVLLPVLLLLNDKNDHLELVVVLCDYTRHDDENDSAWIFVS